MLKNKIVLVTGAYGFVGSHLVRRLIKEKASVISLNHSRTKVRSSDHMKKISGNTPKEYFGGVENKKFIENIFSRHKIDLVYHLAAQPLVEEGQNDPTDTFEVNIKGTWNVLESSRIHHVKKIISASTVHVYGDNPNLPFKESYYPQPSRPYETSKAAADLLAQTYADTYHLSIEIPRFSNIYGPEDQNTNRIIPKIMCSLALGKEPKLWDIGAVRDFLYIDDAINAYILLATKTLPDTKRGRVINFGSGDPVTITTLAKKIGLISGYKNKITFIDPPKLRSGEIKRQYVSIEKAKKFIDWTPEIGMTQGLTQTYKWYCKNAKKIC